MTHALADLTRSHVPVPGPPQICVPTAAITTPVAWAARGQRIRFTSAATDPYGEISSQLWTVSLGRTSTTGSGPTLTRSFRRPGVAHVRLVVTDSSGASAAAVEALPVCRCPAPRGAWPPAAQEGNPCQLMGIGSLGMAHRAKQRAHPSQAGANAGALERIQPVEGWNHSPESCVLRGCAPRNSGLRTQGEGPSSPVRPPDLPFLSTEGTGGVR